MNEAQLIRAVKQIIKTELAPILMGTLVSTQDQYRATAQRYQTEAPIGNMRLLQPYGFASRPPAGTQVLVTPIDGRPDHLNVTAQFDQNRPAIADGETVLYGPDGQIVYMQTGGKILIGSMAASSPMVLGDILQNFCDQLVGILVGAIGDIKTGPVAVTTTPGNPAPTHPTLIAALTTRISDLMSAQSQFVDTSSSNFLSQTNFTERGT
jgi:hypothetical protein